MAQVIDVRESSYTKEQREYLTTMQAVCDKAKKLVEQKGYVITGMGGDTEYCYCGEGNGYEGAPIRPSCLYAVIVATMSEANDKAKELNSWGYMNGAGHKIVMVVEEARYYFERLHKNMLCSINTAKRIFEEANNNRK